MQASLISNADLTMSTNNGNLTQKAPRSHPIRPLAQSRSEVHALLSHGTAAWCHANGCRAITLQGTADREQRLLYAEQLWGDHRTQHGFFPKSQWCDNSPKVPQQVTKYNTAPSGFPMRRAVLECLLWWRSFYTRSSFCLKATHVGSFLSVNSLILIRLKKRGWFFK